MKQLGNLKATLAGLEPAKLLALGGVAAAMFALVAWVAVHVQEPKSLLYSGLDPAEAGHIAARLDELKVPFEARGDGGTILVAQSQVGRVRMELAADGLPHQAGAGYELLDNQSPMNMTSFMQRVQRARALEGELARTIMTLDGVRSARVHLVLPEREGFSRETPKPTASVAVVMAGPMRLTPRQAAAIRLLVAGAVPRLNQDDVSVLDPSGVVIAADGEDALAGSRIDDMTREREMALQRAATDVLEPLLGHGHVKAVVSVRLDSSRQVSHEEKFDPLSQVERSKQTQSDRESSDDSKPAAPVTVGQNLPNQAPAQAGAAGKTSSATSHSGETINYELNSVRSDTVREPGAIARLTAAVVVDGVTDDKGVFHPRPKEELDRIAELARSAVGFDAKRGDVVTVETMRFLPEPVVADDGAAAPAPAGMPWVPIGVGGALAVGLVALLLLRRRRGGVAEAAAPAATMALEAAEAPAQVAGPAPEAGPKLLPSPEAAARQAMIDSLHEAVDHGGDEALAVIRTWIADGAPA